MSGTHDELVEVVKQAIVNADATCAADRELLEAEASAVLTAVIPLITKRERERVLREMRNWALARYSSPRGEIDAETVNAFAREHGLSLDQEE